MHNRAPNVVMVPKAVRARLGERHAGLEQLLHSIRQYCGHADRPYFVVISLGAEHAKPGDEERKRIFVTPVLVHFAGLLLIALATLAPASNVLRACILGAIGCVGLAYVPNLALLAKKRIKECEREFFWDALLPLAAYVCILVSAAAWLLGAPSRRRPAPLLPCCCSLRLYAIAGQSRSPSSTDKVPEAAAF